MNKAGKCYVMLDAEGAPIKSEQGALDIVALCMEHNAKLVLIDGHRFSDDFLRLGTGIAGAAFQKWGQYRIKVAATLDQSRIKGNFAPFLIESNRGNMFHTYDTVNEAEEWLLR